MNHTLQLLLKITVMQVIIGSLISQVRFSQTSSDAATDLIFQGNTFVTGKMIAQMALMNGIVSFCAI